MLAFLIIVVGVMSFIQYKVKETEVISFEESEEILENPARGFYVQLGYREPERLSNVREEGYTLVLLTMHLKDYIYAPIASEELDALTYFLQEARRQHIMVIFRAAYLWGEPGKEPALSLVKEHVKQLSAVLNVYKDVVFVVQTGMVGLWGEWHSSVYLKDEETARQEAIQIVKWWQECLDESILLNLRTPYYISMAIEEGCDASRLGLHNDALLATDTDLGTYFDREGELAWCEVHLDGMANGGEMPYVSKYTEVSNVQKEFEQLSITYLNAYYNTEVLETWKEESYNGENALSYIEKRLGYRYYVKNITVNKKIYPFSKYLNIQVELGNRGFSSVVERFHLYLVIETETKTEWIRLNKTSAEGYSVDTKLPEDRAIKIGLCYMDERDEHYDVLPEYAHTIVFANQEIVYKDGVNYLIEYVLENEGDNFIPKRMVD